jgi:asparagine synthase (glutamine-hydrolysing)
MCGLAGFCDFSFASNSETLKAMTDRIAHRGPDDSGSEIFNAASATIGLGHRRLSIIDLSPSGHQPMSFDGLHVIFNGEIYNYQEIRKGLQELGHTFQSHSDTEVILKSYRQWGDAAVEKFIGMFALVMYDERNQEIILLRDRTGVKPLYYYFHDGLFLFASELKAFHAVPGFRKDIDQKSLKLFFQYGYIPAPYSIFSNTWKLPPGHILKFRLSDKKIEKRCYWDVLNYYNKPKLQIDFRDALEETERILISAFKYRMVADVPVGVFLSGGYDSSTVAAILQHHTGGKVKTFSIGFHEQEYNEAHYAKAIATHLGTDHTEYYCSINEAKNILPVLPEIYDEPFGDSSGIPTTLVSRLAVQQVKVALSADAGDEIFAGYGQLFYFLRLFNRMKTIPRPARRLLGSVIGNIHKHPGKLLSKSIYNLKNRLSKLPRLLDSQTIVDFNGVLSEFFTREETCELLSEPEHGDYETDFSATVDLNVNDGLNALLAIYFKTYLPDDILAKVDRATMSASLEGREPLLDHRIIEYVAQLPSNFKYRNGISKYLLREITHKYIPSALMDRPKWVFRYLLKPGLEAISSTCCCIIWTPKKSAGKIFSPRKLSRKSRMTSLGEGNSISRSYGTS